MNQNFKLFRLLSTLSKKEWATLKKMTESNFFNTDPNLTRLLIHLKKYQPHFNSPHLTVEKLFKKIYPTLPYQRNKITDLMHHLSVLTEQLFLMNEVGKGTELRKHLLRKVYFKRNLFYDFELITEKEIRQLEKKTIINQSKYAKLIDCYGLRNDSPVNFRYKPGLNDIQVIMDLVDERFILEKLYWGVELLGQQKDFSEAYHIHFLEDALKKVASGKYPMVFRLFSEVIHLYQNNFTLKKFQAITILFSNHIDALAPSYQALLFKELINLSIIRFRIEGGNYNKETFKLYQLGLESGALIENGIIPDTRFINIVVIGSDLNEIKWIEQFIETYQSYLPKEAEERAVFLATAYLRFQQNQFEEARYLTQKIEPHDITYDMKMKELEIRCLYELFLQDKPNADIMLLSKMETFQHYLNETKKVRPTIAIRIKNFLSIIKLMTKARLNPNLQESDRERIIALMHAKNDVIAFKWLREKIEKL